MFRKTKFEFFGRNGKSFTPTKILLSTVKSVTHRLQPILEFDFKRINGIHKRARKVNDTMLVLGKRNNAVFVM